MTEPVTETKHVKASRIREAREFIGFTVAEVANAIGCEPSDLERIETGGTTVTGEQVRRLMRLYRRPLDWFTGESRFEPGEDLLRKVEDLSEHDRSAVLEFAEFLQGAGPPERPRRDRETPDARD